VVEKEGFLDEEEALSKSELYVLATLNTIKKVLAEGFEYKDIVILTRKRGQGVAIANYLTEQGIPLLSSETLMIQHATEVRFIIHLLKYLKNNSDKDSKANFLYFLAKNNQDQLAVSDFIEQGMTHVAEYDFENWLQRFDVLMSFESIRKKSLYEIVETIVSKFLSANSFDEKEVDETETNIIPTAGGGAYVQYFLDIVLERDIRNQAGIGDFLNYWDKNASKFSIPSPEGNNAVRIMTIHKSKGLEFPVVIMPFADEDYSRSPKDKLWIKAEEEDFALSKVLIDNSKAVEGFGENAKLVYDQKAQEDLLDNINVLYVALTRAEEQLYVISQTLNPNKDSGEYPNNMASFFIKYLISIGLYDKDVLEYELGDPHKLSTKEPHKDTSKIIPLVREILNPKNIKIAQRESVMWGTHQQEAIEYGNVIHEILSFVKTKDDVVLAITKAIENGLITVNQKELVFKTITEIVNHPELLSFFEGNHLVLNEQTIIQKGNSTIKPDRMVLLENKEVLLLDYKTGTHHSKYQLQLENYQSAIEKMGYKVIKKSLIYIGEKITVINAGLEC
jgi:ATP-dependent exoDNAse (exonuclease V) beta subunit